MTDDQFIQNKTLGDGFGFSAYDLKIQVDSILGVGGYTDGAEAQMITGAYHNGPLSAIRYVGVVGLILYTALQIAVLIFAQKLVRRAWDTPYRALAMFLAMPLLYSTIAFFLILVHSTPISRAQSLPSDSSRS